MANARAGDAAKYPLHLVHAGGLIEQASPELAEFLGYDDARGLVGRPALDIVHPDDRPYIAERISAIYELRRPTQPALQRLLHRDGRALFVEIHSVPVTGPRGTPAAMTLITPRSRQATS